MGDSDNRQKQSKENTGDGIEAATASENFDYDILKSINNHNAYLRNSHVTPNIQSKNVLPPSPVEKSTVTNSSLERTDTVREENVTANAEEVVINSSREHSSTHDTTIIEVTDKGQKRGYNLPEANDATNGPNNHFTASNTRTKSPVRLPYKLRLKKSSNLAKAQH